MCVYARASAHDVRSLVFQSWMVFRKGFSQVILSLNEWAIVQEYAPPLQHRDGLPRLSVAKPRWVEVYH